MRYDLYYQTLASSSGAIAWLREKIFLVSTGSFISINDHVAMRSAPGEPERFRD